MTKRENLIPVKIYLQNNDKGRKLHKRLENLSKKTGMSVSKLCAFAIGQGLASVEERLLDFTELEDIGGTPKQAK